MRRDIILLSITLTLLLLPLVNAADYARKEVDFDQSIQNPQPYFSITFGENPVDADDDYWIRFYGEEDDIDITFTPTSYNDERSWNYTMEEGKRLYNGDYVFFANSTDEDDNVIEVYINFTIDTQENPIFLDKPASKYAVPQATFGMAKTKEFNLSINLTLIPAYECRYGFRDYQNIDFDRLAEQLFNDLIPFDNFTNNNFTFYKIVNLSDAPGLPSGKSAMMIVICEDLNGDYRPSDYLYVGWDDTAPVFTPEENNNFTEPIINDYSRRNTNWNTQTDDRVYCQYHNEKYPTEQFIDEPDYDFKESQPDIYEDFTEQKTQTIYFDGSCVETEFQKQEGCPDLHQGLDNYPGPYNYTFKAECENIAGLTTNYTYNLTVQFEQSIGLQLVQPTQDYLPEESAQVVFTTEVSASCEFTINGETTNTQGMTHTYDITINEGDNDYDITCNAFPLSSETDSGTFTLDTTDPSDPEITLTNPSSGNTLCNDETTISFELSSTDDVSGIDHYNYTITGTEETITRSTTNGQVSEDIQGVEDSYTITATATDNAGRTSQEVTLEETIYYYPGTHANCDDNPPTTSHSLNPILGGIGYQLSFTCQDDETGCREYISYTTTGLGQDCPEELGDYQDAFYEGDEPLDVVKIERYCWYAIDGAGNTNESYIDVEGLIGIQLIQPTFGIAAEEIFDINITTQKQAMCAHGRYRTQYDDWKYPTLFTYLDAITTQPNTTHNIANYAIPQSTGDEYALDWIILCNSTDGNYDLYQFTLGYDTTDPDDYDFYIDPPKLTNPTDFNAELSITINDKEEPLLCTYKRPNNDDYRNQIDIYNFYNPTRNAHWNLANRNHYTTDTYTITLPQTSDGVFTTDEVTYDFESNCTNLAGRNHIKTFTLEINRSNDMTINIHTPTLVAGLLLRINVSTPNMRSTCTYDLGGQRQGTLRSLDGFSHTRSESIGDGTYQLNITCEAQDDALLRGERSKQITIDVNPPRTPVLSNEELVLCGNQATITATVAAHPDDNDVTGYTCQAAEGSSCNINAGGLVTVTINDNTLQRYTTSITAIDRAGNPSQTPASFTTTRYSQADDECDLNPPRTWIESTDPRPTGDGYDVTINCDDQGGTGCKNTIYTYIETGQACDRTDETIYAQRQTIETPFQVEENGLLCWYAEDNRAPQSNRRFNNSAIQANIGITLIEPHLGISPNKTFNITIQTAQAATCVHGRYYENIGDTTRDHYNSISDNQFNKTGGTTHTTNFTDWQTRNEESYTATWLIACKTTDLYDSIEVELGYDTTPPEITLTLQPDELINPSDRTSTLSIETNEEAVCTYDYPTNGVYQDQNIAPFTYNFEDPTRNEHWNLNDHTHYKTLFEQERLPDDQFYFTYDESYTYIATCTNLAGRSATAQETLIVQHAQNIPINILTPNWVKSNTVRINASTQPVRSICDVSIDSGEGTQMQASQDGLYHEESVSLDDGEYDITISCYAEDDDNIYGSNTEEITVDANAPTKANITTRYKDGITCGLQEAPQVTFSAIDTQGGSGVEHYEYAVSDGQNTDEWTTSNPQVTLPISTPLIDGATYTIRARAVDRAGNPSAQWNEETIQATDENHVNCDEDAPTGWARVTDTPSGAQVTIYCTDQGSGCTQNYEYTLINQGESCEDVTSYSTSSAGISDNAYDDTISVTTDQVVCWRVRDEADNTHKGSTDLTVSLAIWVEEPSFGIGAEQTYDLEIGTSRAANCNYDFLTPNAPNDLADWQGQLRGNFDITGATTHLVEDFNIVTFGASTCDNEECTQQLVVICEENSRRHIDVFEIGYDTSNPALNAYFNPNPLRQPGNLQTTLYTESDDEVWCTYTDTDDETTRPLLPAGDINNIEHYSTTQESYMGYYQPPTADATSYTKTYNVTCTNLAGRSTTSIEELTIAPTNEIDIIIHNDNDYQTLGITLNVTTPAQETTCSYQLNPNHKPTTFSRTQGEEHTHALRLTRDDHYEIIITCTATYGPYQGSRTHQLTADATGPNMLDIVTQENTCSLDSITAQLVSNATIIGLEAYNYSITDSNGDYVVAWKTTRASGTQRITELLTLTPGATYNVQAKAIDNYGRQSSIISRTVTARDESYEACDNEPPRGDIETNEVYGGVDIYVSCEDDGTGCSDYYDFISVPLGAADTCDNGTYTSYSYTANVPQYVMQSGQSCGIVYDQVPLNDTVSTSYTIQASCSDGIQNHNEEGIDCGGSCPASCYTCNNDRQDLDEEGIDCGGVCPRSCDQECGDGIVQPGEECDGSISSTTLTCNDLQFASGTLTCSNTCTIDTGGCEPVQEPVCGNGIIERGEDCDGGVMPTDLSCEDFSLTSGSLSCNRCEIDTTSCEGTVGTCGDGIINMGESCDGEKLPANLACEDFDLFSGELSCESCAINTNGCFEGICGDGEIDQGESCDGLNWGEVNDCSDISNDFSGGMPTCNQCQFNTNDCVATPPGQGEDPYEGTTCFSDAQCPYGYDCIDDKCTKQDEPDPTDQNEIIDEDNDGLPDDWEIEHFGDLDEDAEGDPDEDGSNNYNEYIGGSDPTNPASTPGGYQPPEDHTLGIIFLSLGMFFILAGAGYLTYDHYANPKPSYAAGTGGGAGEQPQQPQIDPQEEARKRQAMIDEMRRRKTLQEEARKKAQEEKAKAREQLLASFAKPATTTEKETEEKKETAEEEQTTTKTATTKAETEENKIATEEKEPTEKKTENKEPDLFDRLANLENKKNTTNSTGSVATKKEVFSKLATLTGQPQTHLKSTITQQHSAEEIADLFKNTNKKDMHPKNLTPVFTHLVSKGTIPHQTAHETIHHLHDREQLTPKQKETILKELEKLKENA